MFNREHDFKPASPSVNITSLRILKHTVSGDVRNAADTGPNISFIKSSPDSDAFNIFNWNYTMFMYLYFLLFINISTWLAVIWMMVMSLKFNKPHNFILSTVFIEIFHMFNMFILVSQLKLKRRKTKREKIK